MKKILGFAVFLVVMALVFGGLFLYNRPLGKALELDIPQELVQAQPVPEQAKNPPAAQGQQGSQPQTNEKICGEKGLVKLITLGQASPMESSSYGADAIRLIWVDYDAPAVTILALPYNLWADADVIDPGLDLPLNEIYQTSYEQASSNQPEVRTRKATQALAQAVVDNYAFVPDHYLTLQQEAFIDFVDQAEIVVDVPYDITIVPEGWHTFQAGVQTMDGDQALDYVRLLQPRTDEPYDDLWGRFARQDQVLWALLDSALKPANWDQIPEMVKTARKMVVTDLSVSQMNNLACMLQETKGEVKLSQVPEELVEYVKWDMFEVPQDPDNPAYPKLPLNIADMIAEIEAGFAGE